MKKSRLIALFLTLAMMFSLCAAAAPEAEKNSTLENLFDQKVERAVQNVKTSIRNYAFDITVENAAILYDFAGNTYTLVECIPSGYFIVSNDSGIYVEYSETGRSPYAGHKGETLYYGGPTYYYTERNGAFFHTCISEKIDSASAIRAMQEQCKQFDASLEAKKNAAAFSAQPASSGANVYVPNKEFFINSTDHFGYIDGGYCSYIAANLVLQYWQSRDMLVLPYSQSDLEISVLTLRLYYISKDLGVDDSADAWVIAGVINKFCEIYGLPQVAAWGVGLYGVKSEINKGRPSMLVCKPEAPISCGEHTVVAYGYTPDDHYIVHFGWPPYKGEDEDMEPIYYTQIFITDAAFHFNACYRMEESQ